jgi:hypothetical protein
MRTAGGFDVRGGSVEAVAVAAREVASSSPSKNTSALDVMRYGCPARNPHQSFPLAVEILLYSLSFLFCSSGHQQVSTLFWFARFFLFLLFVQFVLVD